jgi:hypothetical protein
MWLGSQTTIGEGAPLRTPTELFPGTETFEPAEPMTIRLRGVNVAEDRDADLLRGDNDLVVVTKAKFGAEPPVQRLHVFERDVAPGFRDDFLDDTALAVRGVTNEPLHLRVQVYDADSVSPELIDAVGDLAPKAAVVFPELAPVAGLVGMNAPRLLKLVDTLDNHDQLLDDRLTLEIDPPGTGQDLLQPGYLVCFDERGDGDYRIGSDTRVYGPDGEPYDGSYAVFQVEAEFNAGDDREINRKAAKLLAELNGKGQSESKAALDFLTDTLESYDSFEKLERARRLREKDDRTAAEERLLDDLESDETLAPYLPARE